MDTMSPGTDSKLVVRFYRHPVQNNFKTAAEGRPIFDEQDFISILIPGDKNTKVERKARADDKERFPHQWASFQNQTTVAYEGTPIEQWPQATVSQVAELKALNVFTVEALASLTDSQIQKVGMGGRDLSNKAKAFLAAAKDSSYANLLTDELARRDETIAMQQATIDDLGARLLALENGKAKKAA